MGAASAQAYNDAKSEKYLKVRNAEEARRREYIDKMIHLGICHAQSRNEYEKMARSAAAQKEYKIHLRLNDQERRDFFQRVKDIAWLPDESTFVVLFDDGIIRKIGIDGSIFPKIEIERFQRHAWQRIGSPRQHIPERDTPTASRVAVASSGAIRVIGGEPPFSPYGYIELKQDSFERPGLITRLDDDFVATSFPELREEIYRAQAKADHYRISIPDLSEKSCVAALDKLQSDITERLESVLLLKRYEPFFELPDRILTEKELFAHIMAGCAGAIPALTTLITSLLDRWRTAADNHDQILWKDEETEALAYAITALATLDDMSFGIVKRYLDELDLDRTVYFRAGFFEDVAPSGRWQDPRWLPMAFQHLCGDFAGNHWSTLGFREAANQLTDAETFLELFSDELEKKIRPQLEARAARYPDYIAVRVRLRAEYIAKGKPIPYNNSVASDDQPVDIEAEIFEWINTNLGNFIRKNLSTADPLDVRLRNQLITLRPSVAEQF